MGEDRSWIAVAEVERGHGSDQQSMGHDQQRASVLGPAAGDIDRSVGTSGERGEALTSGQRAVGLGQPSLTPCPVFGRVLGGGSTENAGGGLPLAERLVRRLERRWEDVGDDLGGVPSTGQRAGSDVRRPQASGA